MTFDGIAPQNQWVAKNLKLYLDGHIEPEAARRAQINEIMDAGLKFSMRRDAIMRDLQRIWLDAAIPAGNC